MSQKKYVYDHYFIEVPVDAFDTEEQAANYAIDVARDGARYIVVPCIWTAKIVDSNSIDYVVRVTRKRRYVPGAKKAKKKPR